MILKHPSAADVAELADALDLGSSARKGVEVQVLSSAPLILQQLILYSRTRTTLAKKAGGCILLPAKSR
jgi:hypothetical protein